MSSISKDLEMLDELLDELDNISLNFDEEEEEEAPEFSSSPDSQQHQEQRALLVSSLKWHWQQQNQTHFIGSRIPVRYSMKPTAGSLVVDVIAVLKATSEERRTWTVWEEGGYYPHVTLDLVTDKTAAEEQETKQALYASLFRVPEYFRFNLDTSDLKGFQWVNGSYQPLSPTDEGWYWSGLLGCHLGLWEQHLRFLTAEGHLIRTPEEEVQRAKEQAERERKRAETLAERLRAAGMDPNVD
jgi:Uma2 family endonuclease